jgi:hypothetical protein
VWKVVQFFRNGQKRLAETQQEAWTRQGWNIAAVLEGNSSFVVSRERFFELRVHEPKTAGQQPLP